MTKEEIIKDLWENFGIKTTNAQPKKTYLNIDGLPMLGVFSFELSSDFYFYIEYTDSYYHLPYDANYKDKYKTEMFNGKTKYQVLLSDCIKLVPTSEYVEQEDASFMGETTLRDLAAIMLKKPVSNKEWLNKIIKFG